MDNSTALVHVVNSSTNSVNQMRNVMFLPYDNIYHTNIYKEFIKNDRKIAIFENKRYKLEVTERLLSQRHRDILDIIFAKGKLRPMAGGRAFVAFSVNSIIHELGLSSEGEENRKTVIRMLEELKKVTIRLSIKDGLFKDTILFSPCTNAAYSEKLGKFVLIFDEIYLNMFQKDILVDYKYYLPLLLKEKNGIVKALVRYIISNDWINHPLPELLEEIEIRKSSMTDRRWRQIINEIKKSPTLPKFGIEIDENDIVHYRKLEEIRFYRTDKEVSRIQHSLFDTPSDF